MAPDQTSRPGADALVSFTLRRTHVYGLGGLLIGFVLGWLAHPPVQSAAAITAAEGSATAASAAQPPAAGRTLQVATEGRPSRGPMLSRVTIVEFTDYLCPFCRQHAQGNLPALLQRYGDRVRYVVRNYPIAQLHPRAPFSAAAAECAYDQGSFWEYHERLFATPTHEDATLKAIARELGLDTRRFNRCLDRGETTARVDADIRDGNLAGVTGTPTLFVNGRPIEGFVPPELLLQIIESELRRAGG